MKKGPSRLVIGLCVNKDVSWVMFTRLGSEHRAIGTTPYFDVV
jgi:hypothetical protein